MLENQLRGLIESTAMDLNTKYGKEIEFTWDGGQDGAYYLDDVSLYTEKEAREINLVLDDLTDEVRKYLKENDCHEEELWS